MKAKAKRILITTETQEWMVLSHAANAARYDLCPRCGLDLAETGSELSRSTVVQDVELETQALSILRRND